MRSRFLFLLTLVSTVVRLQAQQQQSPLVQLDDQYKFADQLTAILDNDTANDNNALTSALGVSMAFSLVYPSMMGNAKNQTRAILGYPHYGSRRDLVWNATQMQLGALYAGTCLQRVGSEENSSCGLAEPTIRISNVIWVDSSASVDPDFAAVVGADNLVSLNFTSPTAGKAVNAWVSNATAGLIPEMVADGPLIPLVMLAVNAIYLKASWYHPFASTRTNQDVFYTTPRKTAIVSNPVNFMHMVEYFPYSHQVLPGFQVVQLPFAVDTLSMVVVMPVYDNNSNHNGNSNNNNSEPFLVTSSTLMPLLPQLQETRVALGMPKFQLDMEYSDNLKTALQSMGLVAPFKGGLCIFKDDCSSSIQTIIQKTFISVDEEGVEAAAVTGIAVAVSLPIDTPVEVILDNPFQFFIVDDVTGLVLFEGRLGNPELVDANTAFTARHADTDFWTSNFGVEATVRVAATPSSSSNTTALPSAGHTTTNTTAHSMAPMETPTQVQGPSSFHSPSMASVPSSPSPPFNKTTVSTSKQTSIVTSTSSAVAGLGSTHSHHGWHPLWLTMAAALFLQHFHP